MRQPQVATTTGQAGEERRWQEFRPGCAPSTSASIPSSIPPEWYNVAPIFPGVTQRMVNMAGERLTRLATARGFVIIRAEHLEFRPADADVEAPDDSEAIA